MPECVAESNRSFESGALREIKRRIKETGRITFAEFMDVALYWEDGGYYTSREERWAEKGDYITNLDISPVFPALVAGCIHRMWQAMGLPGRFHIVEVGAGRGWLSLGIYNTVKERYPDLFKALELRIVEKNRKLHGHSTERVRWYGDIEEIGTGIRGCIISNELFDSLPFHRVVMRDGLREIYVGLDDEGRLIDVEGGLSIFELSGYFQDMGISLGEGDTAEVGLEAVRLMRRFGSILESGFVVTFDYGLPARELYCAGRKGNLLCYFRHTMNDDPYRMVGMQDITTHVDFTSLARAGRMSGLEVGGFTLQRYFLTGLGALEELVEIECPDMGEVDSLRHNLGIKELIMPGGVGDVFKVLIQYKGVESGWLREVVVRDMKERL